MTTVRRAGDWIFSKFPAKPTDRQLATYKNLWWRVALSHIPPRDERFEFERDFGMPLIPAVLEHRPLRFGLKVDGGGQHLTFVFPERWLTTQEEYSFVSRLTEHPEVKAAKLTVVDLVTKSPLLIGSFIRDDILIISDPKEGR